MSCVALDHSVLRLIEHCPELRTLAVQHVNLRPPRQPGLGDDPEESRHQHMVIDVGGAGVQTHLQCVVVVGIDAEVGQETVNHQIHILLEKLATTLERFVNLEQDILEIVDDCLDNIEDDIVAVQDIDVCCCLAQLDTSDCSSLNQWLVGGSMCLQ